MDKDYIVFNDGNIGYVSYICRCDVCSERGSAEIFINTLEGEYLDCIKANETEDIIYIGKSLSDGIKALTDYYKGIIERKDKEITYIQSVANFYNKELLR